MIINSVRYLVLGTAAWKAKSRGAFHTLSISLVLYRSYVPLDIFLSLVPTIQCFVTNSALKTVGIFFSWLDTWPLLLPDWMEL